MDKVEKKSLIKSLLSGRLTKKQRKDFADLEPVDIEIRKQWNESGNRIVNMEVKEQIWKKVKARCEYKKNQVPVELRWYFAAASLALLLTIGGFWLKSNGDKIADEFVKVTALQSQMYTLPDSTKVWMESGSSIKYAKAFGKDRKIWLSGNSLFEVCKHEGSTFQVYIDKAFIEVKGTCFLVKQSNAEKNEITLFHGKIEFNVEATGQKTVMKPLQKVIYNPNNAETRIEQIANIKWENGKYNFTDIPLQELISIINQMYNSDVTLAKGINHESAFTGSIRYDEPLEDVVNKICFTLNLNKEEHANRIIIKN
ncbi:FecR domain-containing protein [uncultured Bacteroides sp.]|jgi:transmembrane sensor|uniref:FecR family protein n=1 Tax=uncultured Bacteroides sp. TaxID=162156 RepID=UPI00338D69AC